MQGGVVKANITREELEKDGRTLEQLYFDVTEGENGEKTEEGTQEAVAE